MGEDHRYDHNRFVRDIALDVLGVLRADGFFALLDDRFAPADSSQEPAECGHSFDISRAILADIGIGSEHIEDAIDVLHSQGACCDCEVLYNVAEESRLKSRYWKARAHKLTPET
jgi:hypothetical protein